MADWRRHLPGLDRLGLPSERSGALVELHVADEPVHADVCEVHRWLCDEGHVHIDATLALLTDTRLLRFEIGAGIRHTRHPDHPDQQSHEAVEDVLVRAVALRQIHEVRTDVTYRADTAELADVRVDVLLSSPMTGDAAPVQCDDPECEADHGYTITYEQQALELGGVNDEVEVDLQELLAFAAQVGRAASAAR